MPAGDTNDSRAEPSSTPRMRSINSGTRRDTPDDVKAKIQDLETAIRSLELDKASLTNEVKDLTGIIDRTSRRDKREEHYWQCNLSPALEQMIDTSVTLTVKEWLSRSRALDTALDERCQNQPALEREVLKYMKDGPIIGIREAITRYFRDEMPTEWRKMRGYPDGKLSWTASVLPHPAKSALNKVFPTLYTSFGHNEKTKSSGPLVDVTPISLRKYEKTRIRGMSTMFNSELDWIKKGLSRKILSTFFAEESSRVGPRYTHATEASQDINHLAGQEALDRLVSPHAENILKNAWSDTWDSTLAYQPSSRADDPQTFYDVLRDLSAEVHIERQTRGQERGTLLRSLGECKEGGHLREDWIPDSAFLSRL